MSAIKYSPLFDPLLLHSRTAMSAGESFWTKLQRLDWGFVLINVVLPIGFLLYIAFSLRNRYDEKRARFQEYLVIDDLYND